MKKKTVVGLSILSALLVALGLRIRHRMKEFDADAQGQEFNADNTALMERAVEISQEQMLSPEFMRVYCVQSLESTGEARFLHLAEDTCWLCSLGPEFNEAGIAAEHYSMKLNDQVLHQLALKQEEED